MTGGRAAGGESGSDRRGGRPTGPPPRRSRLVAGSRVVAGRVSCGLGRTGTGPAEGLSATSGGPPRAGRRAASGPRSGRAGRTAPPYAGRRSRDGPSSYGWPVRPARGPPGRGPAGPRPWPVRV